MIEPYRQFTVTEFSGSGCSVIVTPYKSENDEFIENEDFRIPEPEPEEPVEE